MFNFLCCKIYKVHFYPGVGKHTPQKEAIRFCTRTVRNSTSTPLNTESFKFSLFTLDIPLRYSYPTQLEILDSRGHSRKLRGPTLLTTHFSTANMNKPTLSQMAALQHRASFELDPTTQPMLEARASCLLTPED